MKRTIYCFSIFASILVMAFALLQSPVQAQEEALLTPADQEALADQRNGNFAAHLDVRKEVCALYGLEDYVDADYFLNDAFYTTFPPFSVMRGRLPLLDRYQTPAYQNKLQGMVGADQTWKTPKAMQVADFTQVSASWGAGYIVNGLWRLSNQQLAFCANGMHASPTIGQATSDPFEVDNPALRKALYYGYNGPENILEAKGYSLEQMIVATNDFVSFAHTGASVGTNAANGYHWNNWIGPLYDEVQSRPDPKEKGYVVYMVDTKGEGVNWAGQTAPFQPLAYGQYAPKGELQIRKTSSNTDLSFQNPAYDLTGAQYGLYQDAQATTQIGTFTIQEDLSSNRITDLTPGTYYIRETKAPQGYALDPAIHPVSVSANERAVVTCADTPKAAPVDLLIQKVDADTQLGEPVAGATLENAQFTVRHFPKDAKEPARTWVFRTDAQGRVRFDEAYQIDGDPLYKDHQNRPVVPLGQLTIQETKAPSGYQIDPTIHTVTIADTGTTEPALSLVQTTTIPNRAIELRLEKRQTGTNTPIPGTTFLHTAPDGTQNQVRTDENGVIVWRGLAFGVHTLEEIEPSFGYRKIQQPIRVEVDENGLVVHDAETFPYDPETGTLTVYNDVQPFPIRLLKRNEHGTPLAGAEFTLYADAACQTVVETIETDENGEAAFTPIEVDTTYFLKETKAPDGYRLPQTEAHTLKIEAVPAQDKLLVHFDGETSHDAVAIEQEDGVPTITIALVNHTQTALPVTGSAMHGWMSALGAMTIWIALRRQKQ